MSVDLQAQLRYNVEEMHSSINDIAAWASEINVRDRRLSGKDPEEAPPQYDDSEDEEDAREIAEAKAELAQLMAQPLATSAKPSDAPPPAPPVGASGTPASGGQAPEKRDLSHTKKYSAWEKYDVEGDLKELEARESKEEEARLKVARLENERAQARQRRLDMRNAQAAEELRLKGNAAFSAAQYEEAMEAYTEALELTPRSAVLYANRGLALLKLRAPREAEEDCSAALGIERGHVKALLRRAQARTMLEKYDLALEDLELALEAEPRNGAARRQMQECRTLRERAAPRPPPPTRVCEVATVEHDPDNDDDEFVASLGLASSLAPAPAALAPVAVDEPAASSPAASPAAASPAAAPAELAPRVKAPPSGGGNSLPLPANVGDVERAWRSLRKSPAEWASYVRRMAESVDLRALFKHNLPAEILSAILAALDGSFFPEHAERALHVLQALTCAGRFSILTMCLEKADEKAIASIFDQLRQSPDPPSAEELAALRKKYS